MKSSIFWGIMSAVVGLVPVKIKTLVDRTHKKNLIGTPYQ
jgi:hypothetical protein